MHANPHFAQVHSQNTMTQSNLHFTLSVCSKYTNSVKCTLYPKCMFKINWLSQIYTLPHVNVQNTMTQSNLHLTPSICWKYTDSVKFILYPKCILKIHWLSQIYTLPQVYVENTLTQSNVLCPKHSNKSEEFCKALLPARCQPAYIHTTTVNTAI